MDGVGSSVRDPDSDPAHGRLEADPVPPQHHWNNNGPDNQQLLKEAHDEPLERGEVTPGLEVQLQVLTGTVHQCPGRLIRRAGATL